MDNNNNIKLNEEYQPLHPPPPPANNNTTNKSRFTILEICRAILPITLGIVLLSTGYNIAGAVLLLISPTICLWHYVSTYTSSEQPNKRTLIYTYILTGTLGLSVVAIIQVVLVYAVGWLLLGSDLDTYVREAMRSEDEITDPRDAALRYELSRRWQYWILMLSFAFDAAACLEECLKCCAIVSARRWGKIDRPRDVVLVAVAAAFGLATLENLGHIYDAWARDGQSTPQFALTVLERLVVGLPGHTMMAVITALGWIANDFKCDVHTILGILELPILIHGSFDFLCFAVSAYNGNIGWVHPKEGPTLYLLLVVAVTWLVGLVWLVRRRLRQLGGVF